MLGNGWVGETLDLCVAEKNPGKVQVLVLPYSICQTICHPLQWIHQWHHLSPGKVSSVKTQRHVSGEGISQWTSFDAGYAGFESFEESHQLKVYRKTAV